MANDGKTDYYSDLVLGLFEGAAVSAFGTVYIALFSTALGDAPDDDYTAAGAGSYGEISAGTYARKPIAQGEWTGPAPDDSSNGRKLTNANAVQWTAWDSGAANLTHYAIMLALSGGEMLMWAPLDDARDIANSETFTMDAGNIEIVED